MESLDQQSLPCCFFCSRQNHANSNQLIILPCGDSICYKCFDKLTQPQDEKIYCGICEKDIQVNLKFRQNFQNIRQTMANFSIYCTHHPDTLVEYYCKNHQIMVCSRCTLKHHSDHQDQLVEVNKQSILSYCKNSQVKIESIIKDMLEIQDSLSLLQDIERLSSQEQLLDLQSKIKVIAEKCLKPDIASSLLMISTNKKDDYAEKEEEEKQFNLSKISRCSEIDMNDSFERNHAFQVEQLIQQQIQVAHKEPYKQIDIVNPEQATTMTKFYCPKVSNPFERSSQLKPQSEINLYQVMAKEKIRNFGFDKYDQKTFLLNSIHIRLLEQWIGKNIQVKRVYSATESNGFLYEFKSKTKNIAPNLVLIKSHCNKVFGGFTTKSWHKKCEEYEEDDSAFIFSLTHMSNHLIRLTQVKKSTFHSNRRLVQFGDDIKVSDNCFLQNNLARDFGTTYKLSDQMQYRSTESMKYLAGTSGNFKVSEMNVYQVIHKL